MNSCNFDSFYIIFWNRVVSTGGQQFLSCALAGSSVDHQYTSPNASVDWFDAGHMDTWYMKDKDNDGRDDYCR